MGARKTAVVPHGGKMQCASKLDTHPPCEYGRICRLAVAATAAAKGLATLPSVTLEKGGEGTRRPNYRDF